MNWILSPKYVVYDVKNFTIIKSWLKWSLNGKGRESAAGGSKAILLKSIYKVLGSSPDDFILSLASQL